MTTAVIAILFFAAGFAIVWVVRRRGRDDELEQDRRRTAEERLQALGERQERRRRIGLPDDEERRP